MKRATYDSRLLDALSPTRPRHVVSGLSYPVPLSQCVLLPVPSDPTISFRLWFKVGSQDDPPGKEGLAAITAAMLTEALDEAEPLRGDP